MLKIISQVQAISFNLAALQFAEGAYTVSSILMLVIRVTTGGTEMI